MNVFIKSGAHRHIGSEAHNPKIAGCTKKMRYISNQIEQALTLLGDLATVI